MNLCVHPCPARLFHWVGTNRLGFLPPSNVSPESTKSALTPACISFERLLSLPALVLCIPTNVRPFACFVLSCSLLFFFFFVPPKHGKTDTITFCPGDSEAAMFG